MGVRGYLDNDTAPVASDFTSSDGTIDISTSGSQVDLELSNQVRQRVGYVENIGIDYSAGTGVFTVQGGTASLSATNPGFVTLPSKADPGECVVHRIEADQDFIDDAGASEIINNLFGLPTGVAYSSAIPFFLYAVTNDAEDAIAFMISRVPHATSSPAAANIGAPDDAVADSQGAFFSLESLDETLYDSNPCICIGSFRMVMSASDDWTVQTLDAGDGIGKYQEGREFDLPTGVFGAATGSHILANGGTAPIFGTTDVKYFLNKLGHVDCYYQNVNDGGTDGAGAVTTFAVVPYLAETAMVAEYVGSGVVGTATYTAHVNAQVQSDNTIAFNRPTAATTVTFIQNSDFANGNRQIRVSLRYPIKLAA